MNDNDKYGFSADRPILLENEDLLNRAGFSKDLANAITSWHGKDSLVIALHGDWGAGKSSIKNCSGQVKLATTGRHIRRGYVAQA
jgi:predicted KAP-like P-loop ATPase